MDTLRSSYRGLNLLVELNWDRLLYVVTLGVALGVGAYIGGL